MFSNPNLISEQWPTKLSLLLWLNKRNIKMALKIEQLYSLLEERKILDEHNTEELEVYEQEQSYLKQAFDV